MVELLFQWPALHFNRLFCHSGKYVERAPGGVASQEFSLTLGWLPLFISTTIYSFHLTCVYWFNFSHFYRATLRAVFAVVRYLFRCPSVSPSVRLPRWCIVSTRLKISSNFFLGAVVPSYLFLNPSASTQFQTEPVQLGCKIHGVGKFCDFRLKSPFISETVRDRPLVAMDVNRTS